MCEQTLEIKELNGRIIKVEKQNRMLKLFGLAILILWSFAFLWSRYNLPKRISVESIRANFFALYDQNGAYYGGLSVIGSHPTLRLIDKEHKIDVKLWVTESGEAYLDFYKKPDQHGYPYQPVLTLTANQNGQTRINLYDENGGCRVTLGCANLITERGTKIVRSPASLTLFNEKGTVIWKAPPKD